MECFLLDHATIGSTCNVHKHAFFYTIVIPYHDILSGFIYGLFYLYFKVVTLVYICDCLVYICRLLLGLYVLAIVRLVFVGHCQACICRPLSDLYL